MYILPYSAVRRFRKNKLARDLESEISFFEDHIETVNKYENWEYGSMYYPVFTDEYVASHAVTIVGWDDHYSRDLFGENTPPGDGAFLIKNR